MNKFTIVLILIVAAMPVSGAEPHPEKHYQKQWCEWIHGVTEFVLDDMTRIDCLTEKYAVEVENADKWAESIGQALKSGKQAGIVLIMRTEADKKHLRKLMSVITTYKLKIKLWTVNDRRHRPAATPK